MIKKVTNKAMKMKIVLNTSKANLFGMFMLEGQKRDTWKRGRMTS